MSRGAQVNFIEVNTRDELPSRLDVGTLYFVVEQGAIIVNHGNGRVAEYPSLRFQDLPGVLPIAKGGTGAGTADEARANLGALGADDNIETASRLFTRRQITVSGAVTGMAEFDGSEDVTIQASPASYLELIERKVTAIRSAAQANHTNYPSERAVRDALNVIHAILDAHNWLETVAHDGTLTGLGTAASPLGLAPGAGCQCEDLMELIRQAAGGQRGLIGYDPDTDELFVTPESAGPVYVPVTGVTVHPTAMNLDLDDAPVAPTITTASLPAGTVGAAFVQPLEASGDAPITWTLTTGSVPAGLSFLTVGAISGTPTTAGTSNFTVTATNSAGSDSKPLTITIGAAAPVPPSSVTVSPSTLTLTL